MTNEMELENKKEEVKMPWQGKVWLGMIFLGYLFLFYLMFLNFGDFLKEISRILLYNILNLSYNFVNEILFFSFILLTIILIPFSIIGFFSLICFDLGHPILALLLMILFIFLNYLNIFNFLKGNEYSIIGSFIFQLIIILFALIVSIFYFSISFLAILLQLFFIILFLFYISNSCLKHLYFNQKKIKN